MKNQMTFGFKEEDMEIDKDFRGSIFKAIGLSKYICPVCKAHLKMADNGELICLNACHLSKRLQVTFSKEMKKIKAGGKIDWIEDVKKEVK